MASLGVPFGPPLGPRATVRFTPALDNPATPSIRTAGGYRSLRPRIKRRRRSLGKCERAGRRKPRHCGRDNRLSGCSSSAVAVARRRRNAVSSGRTRDLPGVASVNQARQSPWVIAGVAQVRGTGQIGSLRPRVLSSASWIRHSALHGPSRATTDRSWVHPPLRPRRRAPERRLLAWR